MLIRHLDRPAAPRKDAALSAVLSQGLHPRPHTTLPSLHNAPPTRGASLGVRASSLPECCGDDRFVPVAADPLGTAWPDDGGGNGEAAATPHHPLALALPRSPPCLLSLPRRPLRRRVPVPAATAAAEAPQRPRFGSLRGVCGVKSLSWTPLQGCERWVEDAAVAVRLREAAAAWGATYEAAMASSQSPWVTAGLILAHAEAATALLERQNPALTAVACFLLDYFVPDDGLAAAAAPSHAAKRHVQAAVFVPPLCLREMLRPSAGALPPRPSAKAAAATAHRRHQLAYLEYLDRVAAKEDANRTLRRAIPASSPAAGAARPPGGRLLTYLKEMPCFEQHRRAAHHFDAFAEYLACCMGALGGKKLMLSKGVARWQHHLATVVFKGWRNSVRVRRLRGERLVELNRRHQTCLRLRQTFVRLRQHAVLAAAQRRQQAARRRLGELSTLEEELSLQNQALQDGVVDYREKIGRERWELEEAARARSDGEQRLRTQRAAADACAAATRLSLESLGELRGCALASLNPEEGRRRAEDILLPWASRLSALGQRLAEQSAAAAAAAAAASAASAAASAAPGNGPRRRGRRREGRPSHAPPPHVTPRTAATAAAAAAAAARQAPPLATVTISDFSASWQDGQHLARILTALGVPGPPVEEAAGVTEPGDDSKGNGPLGDGGGGGGSPTLDAAAVRRVEGVAQALGRVGVEVQPLTLYEGQADVVLTVLFKLWRNYGDGAGAGAGGGGGGASAARSQKPVAVASESVLREMSDAHAALVERLSAQRQISHLCTTLMVRRGHSAPAEVLTSRQMCEAERAVGRFECFSLRHVVPYPVAAAEDLPAAEFAAVRGVFAAHFADLLSVFGKYSVRGRMDYAAYCRFLTDCHLFSKTFSKAAAARVYARVNQLNSDLRAGAGNENGPAYTDEVLSDEMKFDAGEFAQMLIHVVYGRQQADRRLRGRRLSHLVEALILSEVVPNAGTSEAAAVRKLIWSAEVQQIVRKHRRSLMAWFRHYACRDAEAQAVPLSPKPRGVASQAKASLPPVMDPNTISVHEWRLFLTEQALLDAVLTQKQATLVFDKVRGPGEDECLVYCEFEDAVCALAAYKHRNPYTPFAEKVHAFLESLAPGMQKVAEQTE